MKNQPNKKRTPNKDKITKWLIRIPLAIAVIAVSLVVLAVLRQGNMAAAVRQGITLTPASTEPLPTEPTETEPVTTEPSTELSTEPPTEPVDPVMELAEMYLADMSLEEKLCQMILTTPDELTGVYGAGQAADGTRSALETYPVGGILYEQQNIQGRDQLATMIANSQDYSNLPLFIAVAEEGGNVAPLTSIGVTSYYSTMAVYGEEENVQRISEIGLEMAEDLLSVGINVNLAPVADVLTDPYDTEIGSRSFGANAGMTAQLTTTMLQSLQKGGVTACVKYFPGLASADGDSRYGQAVSQRTEEELRLTELLPFAAAIENGAQMIMVSHISLPQVLGDDTPCSLSHEIVTNLLRNDLGYEGLILSDALNKAAVSNYYEGDEAAVMAVQAGCDILLQPEDLEETLNALLTAVENGEISEERINESVLRILYLKVEMGLITQ